ncbi:hypothetical protein KO561_05305 [Radiobacillus kanasensis]|uniref:hypothetical protein n=1 Tax=Radiobacillus kanasensis TaxID=2844358 RepID=UPI001E53A467|nr:hypothetical protein [Radiobacillus kanasensis]UFU00364.1 hypothetical protein KO561_05305 [Radiobacillus kanasensis]
MPFKVLNFFRDTKDPQDSEQNKVIYEVGHEYPRKGYQPPEERIAELTKKHPKYKRVFIEEVQPEGEEPKLLTQADIKKMNKGPQEELIKELNGDPNEAKNEEERIALIIKLQEKSESDTQPSPEQ